VLSNVKVWPDFTGCPVLYIAACGFTKAKRLRGRVATASTSGLQGLYKPGAGARRRRE
jgi:hypothetical protein